MPGIIKSLVEVANGILGIFIAFQISTMWFIILFTVVVISFLLDWDRHLWMNGRRKVAPEYVTYVHKN